MILASTLPDTVRREMPRLMPHSARSPFCLYTRIMLAFFHCCGRHLADQQQRKELCSFRCKAHPPYLNTSAGILSGPAALLSLRLRIAFSTSSKDGGSSSFGMTTTHGLSNLHFIQVTVPDNNTVDEVPVFGPGMHACDGKAQLRAAGDSDYSCCR